MSSVIQPLRKMKAITSTTSFYSFWDNRGTEAKHVDILSRADILSLRLSPLWHRRRNGGRGRFRILGKGGGARGAIFQQAHDVVLT